ncbi:c-type cytochrome [Paracidovorax anthurii]|uniref:Cytochrome c553 n=1 Tax=Paracidovorax anthurii TaxID=78229 RepID=A0A328ZF46_9BURK|nr:c-type cytochrome [Paracidovorax anthurii]RAR84970.1 cytochrome c553 [Paracidovorax anthurii]
MRAHDRWWPAIAGLAAAVLGLPAPAQQPGIVQEGQAIATQGTPQGVPACIGCHGAQGQGAGAFPRLAGSGQAYLQAQLDAFADGSRQSPVMQPFATKLSPQERQSLARYYSQLASPFQARDSTTATPADSGAMLATRGRWSAQLPACMQCHGPGGNGTGSHFPPLAGLPAAYISQQLHAWKSGGRPPGPLGLMRDIALKLSDQDIDAVAAYYAMLPSQAGLSTQGHAQ